MNKNNIKYVYPILPCRYDFLQIRVAGSGLANCLFVYAYAIKKALQEDKIIISPTWFNFSIGPYIRHQSDKRHYCGLFTSKNEVSGMGKVFQLLFNKKKIDIVPEDISGYFRDIIDCSEEIGKYILDHVSPSVLVQVNSFDFNNCVAVHVRLGDYVEQLKVPISWYINKINQIREKRNVRFLLFSDGTNEELRDLLAINNVERVYFGSALADIIAISKCDYLIGSDSTFSGWGAYIGQVPCVFYRKHYGPILKIKENEIVENK